MPNASHADKEAVLQNGHDYNKRLSKVSAQAATKEGGRTR